MNHPIVTLTKSEFDCAARVGLERQLQAMKPIEDDRTSVVRDLRKHWNNSIIGAAAESAVAKHLCVYWGSGVNTFRDSDIAGLQCEVRCSPSDTNLPKVRERDQRIIIAVISSLRDQRMFKIWGWLSAEEAKRSEWKCERPPACYFPPIDAWKDIDTLKKSH